MKLPTLIQSELDSLTLPWRIEAGSKHAKLYVNGQFCGILCKAKQPNSKRAWLNIRAQIRRAARATS
ncbi:MAG: hypothetical protein WC091_02775 [Sulfuricellaceae bacterium]